MFCFVYNMVQTEDGNIYTALQGKWLKGTNFGVPSYLQRAEVAALYQAVRPWNTYDVLQSPKVL